MTIEERLRELEKQVAIISITDSYIKPSDLAKMMKCSKNHIYVQIRNQNIKAVHIGGAIRIPLSQFNTTSTPINNACTKTDKNNSFSIHNIRSSVFE